ncbi:50S ribosomal protein L29 [Porphyromonas sp.]|uniref:50S ribosomal protein L29 n=1 Tax=Porphyromonas sp. TaxID=1924944 RepID=UPI0026DBF3C4|nr:50S ribosomal protein L29 [Porphyromonas sp.]MDO4695590.1 50S ribosomal protein L29 [Porphyromonas sp.]MDO4771701.1 50S ribosomal protein L29 [Porphyromonas sp.]
MKNSEIRELSVQELQERLSSETMKYEKMKMNHSVTPLDKPSELTRQRRLIARLNTVLREKNNNQ